MAGGDEKNNDEWDQTMSNGKDIRQTPAFTALESILSHGQLSQTQVNMYKSKYQKLHQTVVQAYANEKNLLNRAKELNMQLQDERSKLEKKVLVANDTQAEIDIFQKEEREASNRLALNQDRLNAVDFETEELVKQEKENELMLQERRRNETSQMLPIFNKCNAQIEELKTEVRLSSS